jgi:hypothetical protein
MVKNRKEEEEMVPHCLKQERWRSSGESRRGRALRSFFGSSSESKLLVVSGGEGSAKGRGSKCAGRCEGEEEDEEELPCP